MSILVSPNSSSLLLQNSQNEISNSPSGNTPVLVNDSLLLSRYAATIHYLEENANKGNESKTPALYLHKNAIHDGSALEEEEDTESEEDDDEDLLSSSEAAFNVSMVNVKGKTPPPPAAIDVSTTSYFSPLSSSISQSTLPPTIQTYLPQLNLDFHSPCSTPIASIRSNRSIMNRDRGYSVNSALKPPSSCFRDTSKTVQNPTNNILSSLKQQKPLYPSSPSFSSIKMDIRSPPQPSQSTSRFMNAFQRFKNSSLNQHGRNHQGASVAPAEIITSMKLSPSKSSLADKIKIKFQKLDKTKRSSFMNDTSSTTRKNSINAKKNSTTSNNSTFSMPRSSSISSISNWSSRLTATKSTTSKQQQKTTRLSHSTSMTSFLSSKSKKLSSAKPTPSISSSSTSSDSSSEEPKSARSSLPSPKLSKNAPLSLTKSISSHRLYKNNSNHDNRSSTSSQSSSSQGRPRQPLRAVNPNESVRLSRQLLQQQQTKTSVRFNKVVAVKETFSKNDYDRGSDPDAVCTRLTPAMAQLIKEELNAYKLHEMQVHEFSRVHTHFFL